MPDSVDAVDRLAAEAQRLRRELHAAQVLEAEMQWLREEMRSS
jgi:hypothetical protein